MRDRQTSQPFHVGFVACHTAVTFFGDHFTRFLPYVLLTLSQILVAQKRKEHELLILSEHRLQGSFPQIKLEFFKTEVNEVLRCLAVS